MLRVLFLLALLFFNAGCSEPVYSPPAQRTFNPPPIRAVLQMGSALPVQPWASLIDDVLPAAPGTDWQWVRHHPEFQFQIKGRGAWRLTAKLTSVVQVLNAVHAQRVAFVVNGTQVGTAAIDRPGTFEYSFPAGDVFESNDTADIRLDIDPCLVIAEPRQKPAAYCLLLHSIGLTRDPL